MKKSVRHFKVVLEAMSTSSHVKGLVPTTKRARDIATDHEGSTFWILYSETDERHTPRQMYLCLFDTEKEARETREELLYSWGGEVKVYDYKKDEFVFLDNITMERPVRFIVQKVSVVGG